MVLMTELPDIFDTYFGIPLRCFGSILGVENQDPEKKRPAGIVNHRLLLQCSLLKQRTITPHLATALECWPSTVLIPNHPLSAKHDLPLDLCRQPSATRSSASPSRLVELRLSNHIPSFLPRLPSNTPSIFARQSPKIRYGIALLPHHFLDPPILFPLPIYAPLQLFSPSLHRLDSFSDVTDVAVRFHLFLFSQFRVRGRALSVWGLEMDNRSTSTVATVSAHAASILCLE